MNRTWTAGMLWASLALLVCARAAAATDCTGRPDGATCDAGTDATFAMTCSAGACTTCTPDGAASPPFVDNGDGTITDRGTCLVWEKKDNAGGIHDLNDVYQWSASGTAPDGSLFTTFLASLNSAGFAGHHDWRIPTAAGQNGIATGQPAEAESIEVDAPCGDGIGGCMPPAFNTSCGPYSAGDPPYTTGNPGCTIDGAGGTAECSCAPFYHSWTDSTVPGATDTAWLECYTVPSSGLSSPAKTDAYNARAVRGSAAPTITCAPSPEPGCFAPAQSRTTLSVNPMDATRNKLVWSWSKGAAVDALDLGDPVSATDYALCVYGNGTLIAQATIAHGSKWKATSDSPPSRYSYHGGASSGVRKARLMAGDSGTTKASVTAVGGPVAALSSPFDPSALPVTVQLVSSASTPQCWTSDYTSAPQRNDATRFQVAIP